MLASHTYINMSHVVHINCDHVGQSYIYQHEPCGTYHQLWPCWPVIHIPTWAMWYLSPIVIMLASHTYTNISHMVPIPNCDHVGQSYIYQHEPYGTYTQLWRGWSEILHVVTFTIRTRLVTYKDMWSDLIDFCSVQWHCAWVKMVALFALRCRTCDLYRPTVVAMT